MKACLGVPSLAVIFDIGSFVNCSCMGTKFVLYSGRSPTSPLKPSFNGTRPLKVITNFSNKSYLSQRVLTRDAGDNNACLTFYVPVDSSCTVVQTRSGLNTAGHMEMHFLNMYCTTQSVMLLYIFSPNVYYLFTHGDEMLCIWFPSLISFTA